VLENDLEQQQELVDVFQELEEVLQKLKKYKQNFNLAPGMSQMLHVLVPGVLELFAT
jgi:hypothetical protein